MTSCGHQCYRCKSFSYYYIINEFDFKKTKSGYCRCKRKNVNLHDSCECFTYKSPRENICKPLIAARLEIILKEISVLRYLAEGESGHDV